MPQVSSMRRERALRFLPEAMGPAFGIGTFDVDAPTTLNSKGRAETDSEARVLQVFWGQ